MALKLIFDENKYEKILLNNCFININGIYIDSIVLKNEEERIKDKTREPLFSEVFNRIIERYDELKKNPLEDAEENFKEWTKADNGMMIVMDPIRHLYVIDGVERHRRFTEEEIQTLSTEFEFDPEWYNNPVIISREGTILAKEYAGEPFTLDSFYNILKNFYTEKGLEVEDI